jgi:hypothetical protein
MLFFVVVRMKLSSDDCIFTTRALAMDSADEASSETLAVFLNALRIKAFAFATLTFSHGKSIIGLL